MRLTTFSTRARPQHATVKDLDTQMSQRSTCDAAPWTNAKPRKEDGLLALGWVILIVRRLAVPTSTKRDVISGHPSSWNTKVGELHKQGTSRHATLIDSACDVDAAAAATIDCVSSRARLAPYGRSCGAPVALTTPGSRASDAINCSNHAYAYRCS